MFVTMATLLENGYSYRYEAFRIGGQLPLNSPGGSTLQWSAGEICCDD